jgi:hypothetical protein
MAGDSSRVNETRRVTKVIRAVKGDLKTRQVFYPDWIVSKNPLMTTGVILCNTVVLLNHQYAMLSHFSNLKDQDLRRELDAERPYLEQILDRFTRKFGPDFRAVLVGGEEKHFSFNEGILADRKIPIVARYHDMKFGDDYHHKDVYVIPATGEVALRSTRPRKSVLLAG